MDRHYEKYVDNINKTGRGRTVLNLRTNYKYYLKEKNHLDILTSRDVIGSQEKPTEKINKVNINIAKPLSKELPSKPSIKILN